VRNHRKGERVEYHQNRYALALDAAAFPGCRWLDLGAGARLHGGWLGRSAEVVTRQAKCVVGCDLVIHHLRQHPNLTHRVGASGDTLPFRGRSFDLVTANMVLEHLARPDLVFAEVARVLAPGGRFVFVTPHLGHPAVLAMSLAVHPRVRSWIARRADGRQAEHIFHTFYRANRVGEIRRLAEGAGLAVRELLRFSSMPMAHRIPVAHALEQFWINLIEARWGAPFRSNLLGVLTPNAVSPIPRNPAILPRCSSSTTG
jgi:ubiquinone/menaquinone biosynthesis C-methylase UbiE